MEKLLWTTTDTVFFTYYVAVFAVAFVSTEVAFGMAALGWLATGSRK